MQIGLRRYNLGFDNLTIIVPQLQIHSELHAVLKACPPFQTVLVFTSGRLKWCIFPFPLPTPPNSPLKISLTAMISNINTLNQWAAHDKRNFHTLQKSNISQALWAQNTNVKICSGSLCPKIVQTDCMGKQ